MDQRQSPCVQKHERGKGKHLLAAGLALLAAVCLGFFGWRVWQARQYRLALERAEALYAAEDYAAAREA